MSPFLLLGLILVLSPWDGEGQVIGVVTTLAGSISGSTGFADGVGTAAAFRGPSGIVMDSSSSFAIVVSCFRGMRGGGGDKHSTILVSPPTPRAAQRRTNTIISFAE